MSCLLRLILVARVDAAIVHLHAIDDPDDRRPLTVLQGDVPSPFNPPTGCPFQTRCPLVEDRCRRENPDGHAFVTGRRGTPPCLDSERPLRGDRRRRQPRRRLLRLAETRQLARFPQVVQPVEQLGAGHAGLLRQPGGTGEHVARHRDVALEVVLEGEGPQVDRRRNRRRRRQRRDGGCGGVPLQGDPARRQVGRAALVEPDGRGDGHEQTWHEWIARSREDALTTLLERDLSAEDEEGGAGEHPLGHVDLAVSGPRAQVSVGSLVGADADGRGDLFLCNRASTGNAEASGGVQRLLLRR